MPEIGAQRAFIERRGLPAYDWNETTLTIDTAVHSLDLSSIIPSGAVWVKFHLVVSSGTVNKIFRLQNTTDSVPGWQSTLYNTESGGKCNVEFYFKLSSSQLCAYVVQAGITNFTLTVLGWIL